MTRTRKHKSAKARRDVFRGAERRREENDRRALERLYDRPFKLRAKQAFISCIDYSVKYQFSDEQSRGCEVWLARNYSSEFHVVDELHAAPTRIGAPVFEAPMRISLGAEATKDPATRRP